ncbi:FAD/NAD(P)-binding domain-containing protein [Cylindrobasidium torrendii FP15055 ss-10]|uniref:FAD/NAD(P)-binding domain-containing protein n=1 Tax=Cylindrobasidium torrendii FP15055 ss-10 TaxID=1314674 RepID=A0A0D7BV36_9AGAR|nr:FAD/NAD(P)-binding domain-containing protein [Cylindrobasidium torrendii FP15055 ss-10]
MTLEDNPTRRNIVIVGGFLGTFAAQPLSKWLNPDIYNVILIDARPFSVHIIAAARMVTSEEGHLESKESGALCPYDRIFSKGRGTFICGTVTGIRPHEGGGGVLALKNGEDIPYEILVLATGCCWPGPLNIPLDGEKVQPFISEQRQMFKDAEHVVFLGGGPVSVELAGEVKELDPSKTVTIVHRGTKLLTATYPDRFRDRVQENLAGRGIDVVLNDTLESLVVPAGQGTVKTKAGKVIKATLIIPTWGTKPNTAYVASSLDGALSETGYVKVKPTLQVEGHPSIFAMGDMIEWSEVKQGMKGARHAGVIAANIYAKLHGRSLKEYRSPPEALILTGGKDDGVGYIDLLWGIIVGAWFARWYISRDLGVKRFRRWCGY